MPIYEYTCRKCKTNKEEIHGIKELPVIKCDKCDKQMERLISSNSFRLVGNGWPGQELKNTRRNKIEQ